MPQRPELEPIDNPYLVPFDGSFRIDDAPTAKPKNAPSKTDRIAALDASRARISELQRTLYAADNRSLLIVFQGLDAAGKDSAIRAIFTGSNPAGVHVSCFKQPSSEELDHDFLWRVAKQAPQRGCIGVFNRSHYEEVLVVRVHPEYLDAQKLPPPVELDALWPARFRSIRAFERHLVASGTAIVKFWLHASADEQGRRILNRLEDPRKLWKFSPDDLAEAELRPAYMRAVEDALNGTSQPEAPWYAIPADSKSYARMVMADIVEQRLETFELRYPEVTSADGERYRGMRKALRAKLTANGALDAE